MEMEEIKEGRKMIGKWNKKIRSWKESELHH